MTGADPVRLGDTSVHVFRGGGWTRHVGVARSNSREWYTPASRTFDIGLRVIREVLSCRPQGHGTDIAMQSARVVLVKGDLRGIAKARLLSRATMRNIRQNLFFAFVYNSLGVPVAAGVLYPWVRLLLNPMIASAAMSLSSVSVIGNALRLRKARL